FIAKTIQPIFGDLRSIPPVGSLPFQADLRLILLNDQSEILLFSSNLDKKLRAIGSRGIPAGTYYLKVVTYGPVRSTYNLTVSAAPISEAKMKALSEDAFDNA
ncbi:MAG: hypothetical protein AAFV72_11340, partial [Cyanobacteria bacterium J06635_1]